MSNIYFSADTHFFHRRMAIEFEFRLVYGFRDEVHMTEVIASNINKVVHKNDILYHLGDFCFGSIEKCELARSMLNCGKIILIKGNHDYRFARPNSTSYDRFRVLFDKVEDVYEKSIARQKFWLSHYSHRIWPSQGKGTAHLFGHSHGKMSPYALSFDVGIDTNALAPYSMDQIFARIKELRNGLS